MLRLERIGAREWRFVYPEQYEQLMDAFHRGIDETLLARDA